jgi:drug/metabolite transporter (DMT)-like permease
MSSNRKLAYLALIAYIIIWGASLPIVKPALYHIDVSQFIFLRYLIAAPLMLPILYLTKPKDFSIKEVPKFTLIEALQVVLHSLLLYQGLKLSTALEASLVNSLTPIIITVGGILFLREKEETHEWEGLGLSLAGTIIIILAPYYLAGTNPGFSTIGSLMILGSVMFHTAYILIAKKHFKDTSKLFVAAAASWVGLIFFSLINLYNGTLIDSFTLLTNPTVLVSSLYMGILGSPIAIALYLFGQNLIEASEAVVFTYLTPLVYLPLSVYWLQESITMPQIIGLFVVTIGVTVAEYHPQHSRIYRLHHRHPI